MSAPASGKTQKVSRRPDNDFERHASREEKLTRVLIRTDGLRDEFIEAHNGHTHYDA